MATPRKIRLTVAASGILVLFSSGAMLAQDLDFGRDVRPILSDKCFKCHGPDEAGRKGRLRLDTRDDALRVLTARGDKPAALLARIDHADPAERMPPADSKLSLSTKERETLRRWIAQDAPYGQHWAFTPIQGRPLPKVENKEWCENEIDFFILASLEKHGLKPTSRASKERLLRRVTFDLTGLPPTLEEIEKFLADTSGDALAKVVDDLLERPAYAERMCSDWPDSARYSDSFGYQVDRDRFVWPWRDWVLRAFRENRPYDEFIIDQIAGDLRPNPTDDQILATTFQRLHPQKVEGGSVPEEFRVEYVADRTHTFGTTFLGLTLECARCHDHKYDPISQREYYQLFAFFNSVDEAGLYSYFTRSTPTPTLFLIDENKKMEIAEVEEKIREAERDYEAFTKGRREAVDEWIRTKLDPAKAEISGRVKHLDFEGHKGGANPSIEGKIGKAVQLSGDDGIGVGVGNFRRYDPFSVALWMNTPDVKERAVVFHRSRAWTDSASRGYQLLIEEGKLSTSLIHFWPGNAMRVKTKTPIPTKTWIHVAITYDGSSRAKGLKIFVDGKLADQEIYRDNLYKNITGSGGDNITIGERFRDRGFTNGLVDEFEVFNRELSAVEVAQIHDRAALSTLLAKAKKAGADALSDSERRALGEYHLLTQDEDAKKKRDELRKRREERSKRVDGLREIMVMRELEPRRPTYVLHRGAYDARGDTVEPQTPSVFPPIAEGLPRNRLGLARWLTSDENPLAARVAVNRFWQMCFGHGLVRTPEDFGSQGKQPTHPELLDWLAHDFRKNGWDLRRLLKKIVLSATYQQDSTITEELLEKDYDNFLLARGASYRLPAEMIRDNALAASEILVDKFGGAPAKPYDLPLSFKPMGHDKGEGAYRRSVYTYWKRTGPAPVMMALDASKRDVCRVKRERTSSPLQALVLLNGSQFVEASRVLGAKMVAKHGDKTDAILREIFRRLTSREVRDRELEILRELFEEQRAYFAANPKNAESFLGAGQQPHDKKLPQDRAAAAGVVANALFNFDECVQKR